MSWTIWIIIGALNGAVAVAAGAFAAHALRARVELDLLQVFQTGATYHMYHALALLALGAVMARIDSTSLHVAGVAFFIGILVFSGSLYTLVLTGERWWGMVTPFGGAALIVGWLAFAWGVLRAAV